MLSNEVGNNYCKCIGLFYAKFVPDCCHFSSDFYAPDFCFARCKFRSHSKMSAAEFKWQQFSTKIEMKSPTKFVSFFLFSIIEFFLVTYYNLYRRLLRPSLVNLDTSPGPEACFYRIELPLLSCINNCINN